MNATGDALDAGLLMYSEGAVVGTGGFVESQGQRLDVRNVLPIVQSDSSEVSQCQHGGGDVGGRRGDRRHAPGPPRLEIDTTIFRPATGQERRQGQPLAVFCRSARLRLVGWRPSLRRLRPENGRDQCLEPQDGSKVLLLRGPKAEKQ